MKPPLQQENLQEKILQNVEAVIGLQDQKRQDLPRHHRLLESVATAFGRPWFLYAELGFFGVWGIVSHLIKINLMNWNIPSSP
ncbi:MAG: hypothetical protein HC860_26730 [Alkalinema sp. RU_4_3]|nr:hypothetical protein [Alkalinema sp. RU_4_3]